MASVSQGPSGSTSPVRHGKCRLIIEINGVPYVVKKLKSTSRHFKQWQLVRRDERGQPVYRQVIKAGCEIACTCEDAFYRGARCKHQRALIAAGLLSGRRLKSAPPVSAAVRAYVPEGGGA